MNPSSCQFQENILVRIPGMLYATATDPIISVAIGSRTIGSRTIGSRTTGGFEEEVNVNYISITPFV
jgi:hypothetical protein